MAEKSLPTDSLQSLREKLRDTLPNRATSDAMMRLLIHIIHHALPAVQGLDADAHLPTILSRIPAEMVINNARLIRHTIRDRRLANELGFTKASFRVYRTHLRQFLTAAEKTVRPTKASSHPDLLPCWQRVVDAAARMIPFQQRIRKTALKTFATFCSARDIPVSRITPETIQRYLDWLLQDSGITTWRRYYLEMVKIWEELDKQAAVPSLTFPPLPSKRQRFGLRWDEAPDHIARAFGLYCQLATADDPDVRIGDSAVMQSTLDLHRETYLDFLGFLQNIHGVDLTRITVPELFQRAFLEDFHRFAIDRAGGKAMAWHIRRMFFLRFFAQKVVVPHYGQVDTDWMESLFEKTTQHERTDAIPAYTREHVQQTLNYLNAQITDTQEENQEDLVALHTCRFAITFLSDHPLRGKNLREAHLGRDITPDFRRFRVNTKNQQIIEEDLSPEVQRTLEDYLHIRKLAGIHSTAVLVSRTGAPLSYSTFYRQITVTFRRACDIHFTPHCFRYLAVGEALSRTGDPIYAGAAIGDRSGRVVEKSYNRFAVKQAAEIWFKLKQDFMNDEIGALPPPLQRLVQKAESDPALRQMVLSQMAIIDGEGVYHGKRA